MRHTQTPTNNKRRAIELKAQARAAAQRGEHGRAIAIAREAAKYENAAFMEAMNKVETGR